MTPTYLDNILADWAMRSPDGLVSGHKTSENVEVLKTVLRETGMSNSDMQGIVSDMINSIPSSVSGIKLTVSI
jgi:hypothetical protein